VKLPVKLHTGRKVSLEPAPELFITSPYPEHSENYSLCVSIHHEEGSPPRIEEDNIGGFPPYSPDAEKLFPLDFPNHIHGIEPAGKSSCLLEVFEGFLHIPPAGVLGQDRPYDNLLPRIRTVTPVVFRIDGPPVLRSVGSEESTVKFRQFLPQGAIHPSLVRSSAGSTFS